MRRLFYFYSIEQCHEPCLKTLTASRYEAWTPNKRIKDKTVGYAVGLFNCYMESFPSSYYFFGQRPIRISCGRLQRLRLQFVNAYSYSAGEGLELYDMINKTVRGEAALRCNFKQRFLSPHPLFWQLAPVKHEIPPNLRSGIFYRHNKVLSPPSSGREGESRSGKCLAQAHAATPGDIGAQGCQRKRFLRH